MEPEEDPEDPDLQHRRAERLRERLTVSVIDIAEHQGIVYIYMTSKYMYMYMCMCMCTCMCLWVYVSVSVYMYMYLYLYICVYVYVYIYIQREIWIFVSEDFLYVCYIQQNREIVQFQQLLWLLWRTWHSNLRVR